MTVEEHPVTERPAAAGEMSEQRVPNFGYGQKPGQSNAGSSIGEPLLAGRARSVRLAQSGRTTRRAEHAGASVAQIEARDRRVVELRRAGSTVAEIGREFGISRDRVARVIERAGGVDRAEALAARFESHLRRAYERSEEILARYRHGVDPQLIAPELALDGRAVKRVVRERRSESDRIVRARALASRRNGAGGAAELTFAEAPTVSPVLVAPVSLADRRASRDREIVELRAAGLTLREIAARFALTHQRVAQIVAEHGGPTAHEVTRIRQQADARLARERAGEILGLWREGLAVGEIQDRTGVSWKAVRETVATLASDADREARRDALSPQRPGTLPLFSDEQLIAGVRAVAERLGHPPTGPEYRELSRRLRLASAATVYMRFGSWSGALRAAGFEPKRAPVRTARWDVEACWRALESVAGELGDPPRCTRYRKLVEQGRELPSAATVRLRLGLWSDIAAVLSERRAELTGERELTA